MGFAGEPGWPAYLGRRDLCRKVVRRTSPLERRKIRTVSEQPYRFCDFRFGHWFDRSRSDNELTVSRAGAIRIAARRRTGNSSIPPVCARFRCQKPGTPCLIRTAVNSAAPGAHPRRAVVTDSVPQGMALTVPIGRLSFPPRPEPRTFVSTRFLPPGVPKKCAPLTGGLTVLIPLRPPARRYGAGGEEGGPCRQLAAAIVFSSSISAARLSQSRPIVSTANLRPLCR